MVNKAKKILPIVLLILIVIILGACSSAKTDSIASSKSDNIYEKITAEKAKQRIDSGEPITILDVRTKEEFDEKHNASKRWKHIRSQPWSIWSM